MSKVYMATAKDMGDTYACGCIGPQNGEPVCPCKMRGVTIENGRYVRKQDLGPVSETGGMNLQEYVNTLAKSVS